MNPPVHITANRTRPLSRFFQGFVPATLYKSIALLTVSLLSLLAMAQLGLFLWLSDRQKIEQFQIEHWHLADEIVRGIEPLFKPGQLADHTRLHHEVQQFARLVGDVNIYLLDAEGHLLADFDRQGTSKRLRVDVVPVQAFLRDAERKYFPHLGTNPAQRDGVVPFVAAPIQLPDTSGFLYVTLASFEHRASTALSLEDVLLHHATFGSVVLLSSFIGVAVIMSVFLVRRFERIKQGIARFKEGDFSSRLDIERSDELGEISTAVNGLVDSIVVQMDQLKDKDARRRELILNMWHDLRGPVTSSRGYIELLSMNDETYDSSKRKQFYERTIKCIGLMSTLLEELQSLGKLETKELVPRNERTELVTMLGDIVELYQNKAESRRIALLLRAPSDSMYAMCDGGMISRVLSNLVENALRYTSEGGSIIVSLAQDETQIAVSVSDTGVGIPSQELPNLFERHYQYKGDNGHAAGISGLGLAIVKGIVEAHGGSVTVTSGENVGTTFTFTLPKASGGSISERSPLEG